MTFKSVLHSKPGGLGLVSSNNIKGNILLIKEVTKFVCIQSPTWFLLNYITAYLTKLDFWLD